MTDASTPRVAALIGSGLRTVFRAMLVLRSPRPIHPRGTMLEGTLRWGGPPRRSGIDGIDVPPRAGEAPVRARLSRSVGLPHPLPDILGLSVRVTVPGDGGDGHADIEFASTGRAFPLRFALLPARRPERARYGILLPYRGRHGAVLLSARTLDGAPSEASWRLVLSYAAPLGRWHAFAVLTLQPEPEQRDQPRFDAGRRLLPGARTYAWVRAVRQPSYDAVQRPHPSQRAPLAGTAPAGASSTRGRPSQPACEGGARDVD